MGGWVSGGGLGGGDGWVAVTVEGRGGEERGGRRKGAGGCSAALQTPRHCGGKQFKVIRGDSRHHSRELRGGCPGLHATKRDFARREEMERRRPHCWGVTRSGIMGK